MPRRGDNIRIRKDGRWEARYPLPKDDPSGRKYGSVYGKTYQEAKDKRELILSQRMKSPHIVSQIAFKDVLAAWQDANRIRLKDASVSRYQNLIDTHILPELGNYKMGELNATVLNRFIVMKLKNGRIDRNGGLAASYVRSIALIIDAAIKYGAAERLCMPLNAPLTKPSVPKSEINVLSKISQEKLERALLTDMNAEKLLTFITLYTGLRMGEALALRWDDLDWTNHILHIRHTISRVWLDQNGKKKSLLIIAEPKTQSSLRVVPVCSKLVKILEKYPFRQQTGFILTNNGSFVSPRTFEYRYKKILKESGVEEVNYHTLRHTFATRCIEADVDIKSLSEILGHADASITLNTYVHSSIELKRCQLEKIVQCKSGQ